MAWIQRGWQNSLISLLIVALIVIAGGFAWQRWYAPPATLTNTSALAALHQTLITKPENIKGNWLHTLNPLVQDIQGDLVWDNTGQRGVMQLINLPPAASNQHYQLWIYDSKSVDTQPIKAAQFTQGARTKPLFIELVPQQTVQAPYKFVLQLATVDNTSPAQILLMVQP